MQATTLSAPTSSSAPSSSVPTPRTLPAALVLAAFTVFSLWVAYVDGPLGFLTLAGREPWGMQLLLDLCIAAFIALSWLLRDARQRKITAWPYVVATMLVGSIGLLSYLVHRGLRASSASAGASSAPAGSPASFEARA